MLSVLGFLVILAPLVIVHEFGHYIFAKIFGVKAEIFSVGFGPRLWHRQMGETELRLSAIPLGGYVKLLGEDPGSELPPELKARALQYADPWKRFFIFFGGPLFNFLFAILVFMAILAIGEPKLSNSIGRVVPGSVAAQAGFQSGDRILEVQGTKTELFGDVITAIMEYPNQEISLKVQRRSGESVDLSVTPISADGFSRYGEQKQVGRIPGIIPYPRSTRFGVSNPASEAAKQGLKTGGEVQTINGTEVKTWEALTAQYQAIVPGSSFELSRKTPDGETQSAVLRKPLRSKSLGEDLGLYSSELFIEQAVEDSPAKSAGIQSGDRLVSIDGKPIHSFYGLKDAIQESGESRGKVDVVWERDGKEFKETIVPMETRERDPVLKKVTLYTIGVVPMLVWGEADTIIQRIWNPFLLAYEGTRRMLDFSWRNVISIGKMFTGDVSIATLGGPILIGKIAGNSLERGLIAFLTTMAILSIGLGILNILPIPVLDGGHLVLLLLETIRGKPLTIRQMEIVQQVGLSLILLLMAVVMRNDLSRLAIFN